MRRVVFVVALMAVLLAGCSGSGGGGEAAKEATKTAAPAAGATGGPADKYAATIQAMAEVEASLAKLVDGPDLNEADADEF